MARNSQSREKTLYGAVFGDQAARGLGKFGGRELGLKSKERGVNKESSFCDRGVNTCWIGLLAGAICYHGGCASRHARQVYTGA